MRPYAGRLPGNISGAGKAMAMVGFRPCSAGTVVPPNAFEVPLLWRGDGGEEVHSIRGADTGRGVETSGGLKGLV